MRMAFLWIAVLMSFRLEAAPYPMVVDTLQPYTITLSAKLGASKGLVVEVLEAAMLHAGLEKEKSSTTYPWLRAQTEAKTIPRALLFPFARTKLREAQWKWVAVAVTDALYIYTPDGTPERASLEALRAPLRIGVLRGGAPNSLATQFGLQVETVRNEKVNFLKLASGRLDAVLSQGYMADAGWHCALKYAEDRGQADMVDALKKIRRGPRVEEMPLWVATSLLTPDQDVLKHA